MAMNPNDMATIMKNALLAAPQPITTIDDLCLRLSTVIVVYIQFAAVVPANTIIAPAGGGPCTGSSTVT